MARKNTVEVILQAKDDLSKTLKRAFDDVQRSTEKAKESYERLSKSSENNARKLKGWKDKTENALESVKGSYDGFASSVSDSMRQASSALVLALGAATAAAGKMGIQFNANLEQSRVAFETLLGSAEESKVFVEDLLQFSKKTPFEFNGLQDSAKLLLGMSYTADQTKVVMQSLGNAVSAVGGGSDTMQRISLALGQMKAKGRVSAEEINQLAENGIPVYDILSKKMGKSTQELMKLGEQGKLLSNEVIPVLISGLQERFAGSMEKQSKTFKGMVSTLKDSTKMFMGSLTKGTFKQLKEILPDIIGLVDRLNEAFTSNGWSGVMREILPPNVADYLMKTFKNVKGLINDVKQTFRESANGMSFSMSSLLDTLKPVFKEIGELINTTIDFIQVIWARHGDEIVKKLMITWDTIVSVLKNVIGIIRGILDVAVGILTGDFDRIKEGVIAIFKNLYDGVVNILEGLGKFIMVILKSTLEDLMILSQGSFEIGKNIIEGLANGMESLKGWLVDKTRELAQGVGNTIKSFFGIASPSKLTTGYGKNVGEGLALGIESTKEDVWNTFQNVAEGAGQKLNAITVAANKVKNKMKESVTAIGLEMSILKEKMKLVESGSTSFGSAIELQREQLRLAKEKVKELNDSYNRMKELKGVNAKETKELYLELLKESNAYQKLAKSIKEANKERVKEVYDKAINRAENTKEGYDTDRIAYIMSSGGEVSDEGYKKFKESVKQQAKRIAEERGVSEDVAEEMALTNIREGKQIYHQGGRVSKLGPREVPIIAEEEEIIIPRSITKKRTKSFSQAKEKPTMNVTVQIGTVIGTDGGFREVARKLFPSLQQEAERLGYNLVVTGGEGT